VVIKVAGLLHGYHRVACIRVIAVVSRCLHHLCGGDWCRTGVVTCAGTIGTGLDIRYQVAFAKVGEEQTSAEAHKVVADS
jgi:uncharacterized membrane protein YjjP (DUF1212 family)